jgi:hypothetical protein
VVGGHARKATGFTWSIAAVVTPLVSRLTTAATRIKEKEAGVMGDGIRKIMLFV